MAWAESWGVTGEEYWLKTRSLGGNLNVSRATLQESDKGFIIQWNGQGYHSSGATWLVRRSPTTIVPVQIHERAEPQYPIFLLMRCYYRCVVNLWFKISDGIGGKPNWTMYIVGLLVKHFMVLTALWMKEMRNWGRSGMMSCCSIVCYE